ncbi:hypothetical protein AAFF_G00000570 [Aldrovandia affinis]|uniref:Uncharacterized protein n=1 Tax=Aldrovandia affinis TaxID=143900 RepID=A0AAD7X397_9TELE|nr:hypothetical protein AAFF_G00000570 [Aldrovandia affinis]
MVAGASCPLRNNCHSITGTAVSCILCLQSLKWLRLPSVTTRRSTGGASWVCRHLVLRPIAHALQPWGRAGGVVSVSRFCTCFRLARRMLGNQGIQR